MSTNTTEGTSTTESTSEGTTGTPGTPGGAPGVRPRLQQRYRDEIMAAMQEKFHYDNVMQTPGLTKIVVNMGVGEAARDSKLIEGAVRDLTNITGQKPQVTKARKSNAQVKLREEMAIDPQVTQPPESTGPFTFLGAIPRGGRA